MTIYIAQCDREHQIDPVLYTYSRMDAIIAAKKDRETMTEPERKKSQHYVEIRKIDIEPLPGETPEQTFLRWSTDMLWLPDCDIIEIE